jgi:hypothetical protein
MLTLNDRSLDVIDRLQNRLLKHREDKSLDRVPLVAIAAMCDVDRKFLYRLVSGDRSMPAPLLERLDAVLTSLDNGEVIFRRVGQVWQAEWVTPPNPLPPPQDRMTRAGDWNEWSACRSCAGRRWTRVHLHQAPAQWYLCDGCMWWETAGVGAKLVNSRPPPRRR